MNYLDTSVLYECYVHGPRSKMIRDFMREQHKTLVISSWVEVEFYGVLGRRMRDGTIPANAAAAFAHKYGEHLARGYFRKLPIKEANLSQASTLVRRFSLGIKAADAVHLGVVQVETLTLVTSDEALANGAKELGLEVYVIQ